MYNLEQSYEEEFCDLMLKLKEKYGQEMFDLDGIGKNTDMSVFSKRFFNTRITADVSIDANSNVGASDIMSYNTELAKPFQRLNSYYMLWREMKRIYNLDVANEAIEAQLSGDIYIHDMHGIGGSLPYCFNYSTYDIMLKGLPMIERPRSYPAKSLYAFKSHVEQFTIIAANSTLGATGLADLFIVMSYYVDQIFRTGKDVHTYFDGWFSEDEKRYLSESTKDHTASDNSHAVGTFEEKKVSEIKRCEPANKEWFEMNVWRYVFENITSMLYTFNQPTRSTQSPFTNVSIYDDAFLDSLCPDYIFPDGSTPNKETVKTIQELFLSAMNSEMNRTVYTFPVTTACFALDDEGVLIKGSLFDTLPRYARKYSFVNIYVGKTSILSSCCRLKSDTTNEYFNSFGAGSSKIGSLGVVTINMPRLAEKCSRSNGGEFPEIMFIKHMEYLTDLTTKINNAKRHIVKKKIDNGNHQLYTHGFMDLSKQYSTTGLNGAYEALQYLGYDITEDDGANYFVTVLNAINKRLDVNANKYKAPHNTEFIPAENVAIKQVKKDNLLKYNKNKHTLYSNQFIPLINNADVFDRIRLQGIFDAHFSGGSALHVNCETPIGSDETYKQLIEFCASNGVIYWSPNYNIQECVDGHIGTGKNDVCSMCGKDIAQNYTRVVGFITPVKNWSKERREIDYPNRVFYDDDSVGELE